METPKKLEEGSINRFDFVKYEIDCILENANFTSRQEEIFNRLTDKDGRQKIVKIAMEMNISERTVNREIKKIKRKILKIL